MADIAFIKTPDPLVLTGNPINFRIAGANGTDQLTCVASRTSGDFNTEDWAKRVNYDSTQTVIDGGLVTAGSFRVKDSDNVEWDGIAFNLTKSNETLLTPSLLTNSSKPKADYVKILTNPSKNSLVVNSASLPFTDYLLLNGEPFRDSQTILSYQALVLVRKEN
jgi:hypothetical protein